MPYVVQYAPAARRRLRKLDKTEQRRLVTEIDRLTGDPRPATCKKLAGHESLWRVRVGSWRIVYRVDDRALAVVVLIIGHRRDIYRDLQRLPDDR